VKLEKTTRLVFGEGKSEKIYEVDLCEVGTNQWVVNFRYGRRGAPLKDGSKTVAPVGKAEAERIWQKLVDQKIEEGYLPEGTPRAPAPTPKAAPASPAATTERTTERAQRILERLAQTGAARSSFKREGHERTWNLERAIWRAGELRLREAEPLLLALIGTAPGGAQPVSLPGSTVIAARDAPREAGGKGLRDYCIAWALGRLGGVASIPALGKLTADTTADPGVRRMAAVALLEVADAPTKANLRAHWVDWLPEALRGPARSGDPAIFAAALATHLDESGQNWAVVELAYLLDTETVRPAVIAALRTVPLRTPWFHWIRHIFKAAELRLDAEVFGILAHRFATTRANFGERRRNQGEAFGARTKQYLAWRAWRTLRRLGDLGDLDYVKMAVGVLLPFTDADAVGSHGRFGPWAPYWAMNQILFGKSARFEPSPNRRTFRLRRGQRSFLLDHPAREERHPQLWEQRPEGLMHLLVESACAPVHAFAAKAIRAVPAFLARLEIDDVLLLLSRPYPQTAHLAFDLAVERWDPANPSLPLLLGLAYSPHPPARERAIAWAESVRDRVVAETSLLAAFVLAPHAEVRAFARRLLRTEKLSPAVGAALVARIVAGMLDLDDDAIGKDATATVIASLADHLEGIQPAVIRDLAAHPLGSVQELGAELLLRKRESVPDDVFLVILHSPHEHVRAIALRLLVEMPDPQLSTLELLLVRLSTDKDGDLRSASRGLVRRVAAFDAAAAETIARGLLEALLRRKLPEGAPSHVLRLLKEDLFTHATNLPDDDVFRLLRSGSSHAQELGGLLLQRIDPARIPIERAVELASHEVLAVRQAAFRIYAGSIDRVRANLAEAAKILDAKWPDARAWAFEFFRRLGPEAFDAQVLVTILDSVREDVQAFGRELTTKYFRDEDGPLLMTRLSEHPSVAVQLYTSNYLERFAAGRPDRVAAMVPYFVSVLSRPNRGRIAKRRIFAFLEREGQRDREVAAEIVALLHRISATMAVEARGDAIAAMVAIHRAHPEISVPFQYKNPESRGADGVLVRV
jgi:hypothetical protein